MQNCQPLLRIQIRLCIAFLFCIRTGIVQADYLLVFHKERAKARLLISSS
ncbi:hypothetical protein PilKf_02327 [Pillotina sp. SPG140]